MSEERNDLPFESGALGRPPEKAKDFRGTLIRLLRYFKPYRYPILAVLVAALFSTVFTIAAPKILGLATTRLFEGIMARVQGQANIGIDFQYIAVILLILLAIYVVSITFEYIQGYIMAGVTHKMLYTLRKEVEDKITHLPLKFFDSHRRGEILSRAVNDVDTIGNTLQESLTRFLTSSITLIGVLILMLSISPLLCLLVLLTLPLSLFITVFVARRSQTYFATQQKELGELNAHVEEMFTGHTIIKAFGREQKAIARFTTHNDQYYEASWRARFVSGIIMPLMTAIESLGYLLMSVIGGIMVTNGAIALGDVQAFIQYASQFTQPISQLASISNVIQSTIAAAERIFTLLDEPEEVAETSVQKSLSAPRGDVEFRQVRFGYQEDNILIKGMNITVRAGQTIAIVGPTGAGKTTLVNLLMRFYEIQAGTILIDGVDITQIRREDLRRMTGMVLQDTWLFHGTIKDNIAYGRAEATQENVMQAAKAAYADHFIRALPEGYDTVLTQDTSNISQGQRQLLTIARAILADPTILILDEATSSVDSRTEAHIQQAMNELMKGKTSFVIAHRLSTIRSADMILVMDHGNIIEKGTHNELLEQNGFYADLYRSQFTGSTLQETSQKV